MSTFTDADILKQLDACARSFTFPMLDNGYVYLGDTRLTAYGDDTRWAIVIQIVGFGTREGGLDGLNNALYCFGNCLHRPPGTANEDFLALVRDSPDGPLFEDEFSLYVRPDAASLLIRGQQVELNLSPENLSKHGIQLADPPKINGAELLRVLLPEHRDMFLATEAELRERVPGDLPELLCLDEWFHPDVAGNELPSQSPTFQMIAQVLTVGDGSTYQPVHPPNTHWLHWPEGGTL